MSFLGQHLGSEQAADRYRQAIHQRQDEELRRNIRDGARRDMAERGPEQLADLIVPLIEEAMDRRERVKVQQSRQSESLQRFKVLELAERIHRLGLRMRNYDGKLWVGPKALVSPELEAEIDQHRNELSAWLAAQNGKVKT